MEYTKGDYIHTKKNVLFLTIFWSLNQIHKINIWHKIASEHPNVIEGGQKFIGMYIIETEEAIEYI